MPIESTVSFHGLAVSDAIRDVCLFEAAKLERYGGDQPLSCHIVIEVPHRHHRQGNQYLVRIRLGVPGAEIVVDREPPEHGAAEQPAIAIREAFDTARRRLQDWLRRHRGHVKVHGTPPIARVARLVPEAGHGFLATDDGREIYFHRHAVLDGRYEDLRSGAAVEFAEEEGDKGPQARFVRPMRGEPAGLDEAAAGDTHSG